MITLVFILGDLTAQLCSVLPFFKFIINAVGRLVQDLREPCTSFPGKTTEEQVFPGEKQNHMYSRQEPNRPRWTALKVGHHRCLQESTYPRVLKDTSPAGHTHNSAVAMGYMHMSNKSTSKYFRFTSVITTRFGTDTCQPRRMCQSHRFRESSSYN